MEHTLITYQETFRLIQELNILIDKMDRAALDMQRRYRIQEEKMMDDHGAALCKFDSEHQSAIENTRARSKNMMKEARRIRQEMRMLDEQLSRADKYYVKTKMKKEFELAGVKDGKYDSNGDYFKALDQIKRRYSDLSHKYSSDILPSLINGLNYLFSSKRKQDYEELIILLNTVDAFVNELDSVMPEKTAETVAAMNSEFKAQKERLETALYQEHESLETSYKRDMTALVMETDAALSALLPDALIEKNGGVAE